MTKTLLFAALSLSLVACIDDLDTETDAEAARPMAGALGEPLDSKTDADDTCHVLPTSDACAAACDEEALMEYIPAGTCVLFRCTLDDGSEANIGGCRPSE